MKKLVSVAALAAAIAVSGLARADETNPRIVVATFLVYAMRCAGTYAPALTEKQNEAARLYAMTNGVDVMGEKKAITNIAIVLEAQVRREKGGIPAFCRAAKEGLAGADAE